MRYQVNCTLYRNIHDAMFTSSLQEGRTALINASSGGHTEVVRLLLQSQADVNAQDEVMIITY